MKLIFHKIPREIKNEANFPFWFSLLKEALDIVDLDSVSKILDFGSGGGGFLKLVNLVIPEKDLTGIEIDDDLVIKCQETCLPNFSFINYRKMTSLDDEVFDISFSQEVIYTLPDVKRHAEEIFRVLRGGGYYIASMGCHIENPTWPKRRGAIRSSEKYYAYDYSLDEIARIFYDVGFRVSVKRLPVHVPLRVSFDANAEFSSINELLESSHEQKIMFSFMKPKFSS